MNSDEWKTIYKNLSQMETEELAGYWSQHNEEEWTPIAFDLMEKILTERLGKLPDTGMITQEKTGKSKNGRNKIEKEIDEIKELVRDTDPVFYNPEKVNLLIKWIYRSMYIVIMLYVLRFLLDLGDFILGPIGRSSFVEIIISMADDLALILITSVLIFFQFKVMAYILKILREMEINSRNDHSS